ncbi:MAG UNVERIFIED_CONTAM: hypothetical protein LVR18_04755 [Planctomycetaceae bacterium]|jgi:hypothetical protein
MAHQKSREKSLVSFESTRLENRKARIIAADRSIFKPKTSKTTESAFSPDFRIQFLREIEVGAGHQAGTPCKNVKIFPNCEKTSVTATACASSTANEYSLAASETPLNTGNHQNPSAHSLMTTLSQRLQSALQLSHDAGLLILQHYQSDGLLVESKSDESPVTIADRDAETLIRSRIQQLYPGDAILGEEFPSVSGRSGYRWIIDPIDGTKAFVHGIPSSEPSSASNSKTAWQPAFAAFLPSTKSFTPPTVPDAGGKLATSHLGRPMRPQQPNSAMLG